MTDHEGKGIRNMTDEDLSIAISKALGLSEVLNFMDWSNTKLLIKDIPYKKNAMVSQRMICEDWLKIKKWSGTVCPQY